MKAAYYERSGTVLLAEVEDPVILRPTDAVVRVTTSAICGSDLTIVGGHMTPATGFTLGHEYVGVVTAVGEGVTKIKVGDRVAGSPASYCGACENCRRGLVALCTRGGIHGSGPSFGALDGGQAEAIRVPWAEQVLAVIPDSVPDETAVLLADVMMTGLTSVRATRLQPTDTLVVFGCGPIGLSAVHAARRLTAVDRIIAVDPVEHRLDVARSLGADEAVASVEEAEALVRPSRHDGADGVIDAAGAQASMDAAVRVAGQGARIAVPAIGHGPMTIDFRTLLFRSIGVWTGLGDVLLIDDLMEAAALGRIDPRPMISHHIGLDEVPAYYERMAARDPDIVKIVVSM